MSFSKLNNHNYIHFCHVFHYLKKKKKNSQTTININVIIKIILFYLVRCFTHSFHVYAGCIMSIAFKIYNAIVKNNELRQYCIPD